MTRRSFGNGRCVELGRGTYLEGFEMARTAGMRLVGHAVLAEVIDNPGRHNIATSVGRLVPARELLYNPRGPIPLADKSSILCDIFEPERDLVDQLPDLDGRKWIVPAEYIPSHLIGRRKVPLLIDPASIEITKTMVALHPSSILLLPRVVQVSGGVGKVDLETGLPFVVSANDQIPESLRRTLRLVAGEGLRTLFRTLTTNQPVASEINASFLRETQAVIVVEPNY